MLFYFVSKSDKKHIRTNAHSPVTYRLQRDRHPSLLSSRHLLNKLAYGNHVMRYFRPSQGIDVVKGAQERFDY